MTREEIKEGLRFTVDMFKFDPLTGEERTLNEHDATTVNACEEAIKVIDDFEALNAINLDLASENEDLVERIGKLVGFIDYLRNTAQGKTKSLNLLEKAVKRHLEEIRAEEPFINKPCVSEGVCKVDVTKMLEHIDEEVRSLFEPDRDGMDNNGYYNEALVDVLEILNSHARRLTDESNS